ncbi:MAG TPA: homoserine kinase [Patescibacteria group bacterium]|nr:homoserine kinase [Patescibacteria group bacterium]
MPDTIKIRVPGTTANCGPGFDTIGVACSIYNDLEISWAEAGQLNIEITGEGAGHIPVTADNVVIKAIKQVFRRLGKKNWGLTIKMHNQIPLSRGLGSSAAAIVAGLFAANEITGRQLSGDDLLLMATVMEGHPDNVAPALFGGITVSIMEGDLVRCLRFIPPQPLSMIVAVPDFHLSTRSARQVLPKTVPFANAVYNVSRTALLVGALCQGDMTLLEYALKDKLHQPYREKLIPGMMDVLNAATEAGAWGAALSGAGPCLIAFTSQNQVAIGEAMVNAFASHRIRSRYLVLAMDTAGAVVL